MVEDSTISVGIDIGDRFCQIAILDAAGELAEESRIRTTPAAIRSHFEKQPMARIAMEVGTHSPWLDHLLRELGHEVLVANAYKLSLIHKNDQKSDKVDAELLARICRFDPQLLYPISHKGEEARAAWTILRARDALVRSRTMLVNHARGVVKSMGHRMPKCSSPRFSKLQSKLPESLRPALTPVFETLLQLSKQIAEYDKKIIQVGQDHFPQTTLLQQVPGVGPLTALAFVLVIDDPWRFPRNRTVGAYLGLAPRRSQSGQSDPELPISKTGNRYLRRLLVQCAHYIIGPLGPDSDLRRHGLRIADAGAKNAKKRAGIAVARRLAVTMLSVWKSGETYEPLRWSKGGESAVA